MEEEFLLKVLSPGPLSPTERQCEVHILSQELPLEAGGARVHPEIQSLHFFHTYTPSLEWLLLERVSPVLRFLCLLHLDM